MGCDGGSIPKRDELVKKRAPEERKPPAESQWTRDWAQCRLSRQPLRAPIVACQLGRLYNKEAVYAFLLDSEAYGDGRLICAHLQRPRDVRELQLTPNPHLNRTTEANEGNSSSMDSSEESLFICPVTRREMNGRHAFIALWSCGCVFAAQALREIPNEQKECLQCGKPFTDLDVIPLNPTDPKVIESLKERMQERQKSSSKKSKEKKRKALEDLEDQAPKRQHEEPSQRNGETARKKDHVKSSSSATEKDTLKSAATTSAPIVPKVIVAKGSSKAIQSIYKSSQPPSADNKGNWLTQGTFTRY